MKEKLSTVDITTAIGVTLFAGLCYMLFVGYFVAVPPHWWVTH